MFALAHTCARTHRFIMVLFVYVFEMCIVYDAIWCLSIAVLYIFHNKSATPNSYCEMQTLYSDHKRQKLDVYRLGEARAIDLNFQTDAFCVGPKSNFFFSSFVRSKACRESVIFFSILIVSHFLLFFNGKFHQFLFCWRSACAHNIIVCLLIVFFVAVIVLIVSWTISQFKYKSTLNNL